MNPNDFVQGGLLNDVDVEIVSARFVAWDYDGTLPSPDVLAVKLDLKVIDTDEEHSDYISCGKIADFAPNGDDDGATLEPQGSKSKLSKNSNWWLFLMSAVEVGLDPTPLNAGNISVLDGMKFHLVRKAAPKREGLTITKKQEGRESQYVAVGSIISVPWDAKAGKKIAAKQTAAKAGAAQKSVNAKTAAPPPVAAAELDDAVNSRIMDVVMEVLGEASGPVKIASMKMLVFKKMNKDKGDVRSAALVAATSAEWLGENGFTVDGDTVTV